VERAPDLPLGGSRVPYRRLKAGVRKGEAVTEPFGLITVSEDPEEQLLCAEGFYEDRVNTGLTRLWNDERYRHEKIRVAYVSGDFREHAVAYCIAELLERHDRSKFEIIGASLGVDDGARCGPGSREASTGSSMSVPRGISMRRGC